jgi:hypothetical protein
MAWDASGRVKMLDGEAIKQIAVEIDGLREVADKLRKELDASFRVQVPKVYDAVQPGATIGGAIVGQSWTSLQDALHAGLQGTADALFSLDAGTQAVTSAAELIAKDYGDSDALARARVQDVHEIMAPPPGAGS